MFVYLFRTVLPADTNSCRNFCGSSDTFSITGTLVAKVQALHAGDEAQRIPEACTRPQEQRTDCSKELTRGFQGPNYWVLKGSRALTVDARQAAKSRIFFPTSWRWQARDHAHHSCLWQVPVKDLKASELRLGRGMSPSGMLKLDEA